MDSEHKNEEIQSQKQDLRWHTGKHTGCHNKNKNYAGTQVNIQSVTMETRHTLKHR